MPFQPIKRSAISEDVTLHIMELIRNGKLRPGDKLPAERQLAESLGVSRVSLREGLRTLAFMNILDVRTGDGTYISSLDSQDLVEPLTFVLDINTQTLQELAQARRLIEPYLAAEAARHITDEELAELNCSLAQMKSAGEDYALVVQHDMELHR
ncbi:MAG: FadR family transcriptional regulator, partial [Anaerolineales bacterium]|nr:FadR family transcriptional regulator [Anaerolineales bacterium]